MPRPERDHLREGARCLAPAAEAVQQDAEVVVGIGVVGIDADRRPVRRFRIGDASQRTEDDAEVVVGVGVARVELDRALVSCGCLVQPETILQDDPEIAVPVGAVGLELDASLDQRDCFVASLLLMGEDSGEVQGPGMIGRGFENAAVDLGSGRVLLGLLQRDRDRKRLVDGQRAVVTRQCFARLELLVGLDVVLEVDARVEGSVRLARPVFDVDLRERQCHRLHLARAAIVGFRHGRD
jgi:hypothetical protein